MWVSRLYLCRGMLCLSVTALFADFSPQTTQQSDYVGRYTTALHVNCRCPALPSTFVDKLLRYHKQDLQSCESQYMDIALCRAKQRIWNLGMERKAGLSGDFGQRCFTPNISQALTPFTNAVYSMGSRLSYCDIHSVSVTASRCNSKAGLAHQPPYTTNEHPQAQNMAGAWLGRR